MAHYGNKGVATSFEHDEGRYDNSSEGSKNMKLNIQRMQWRLLELKTLCRERKDQMS